MKKFICNLKQNETNWFQFMVHQKHIKWISSIWESWFLNCTPLAGSAIIFLQKVYFQIVCQLFSENRLQISIWSVFRKTRYQVGKHKYQKQLKNETGASTYNLTHVIFSHIPTRFVIPARNKKIIYYIVCWNEFTIYLILSIKMGSKDTRTCETVQE